ncbi:MAG: YdcF family protein [Planctomycetaceae bacterium]|nr:YdcF family protein [Planctomycetaceae bacterium]MCB9953625.1 YdcF family protein [Planctomycetaceae bacterium]
MNSHLSTQRFWKALYLVWSWTANAGFFPRLLPVADLIMILGNHHLQTLKFAIEHLKRLGAKRPPVIVTGGNGIGTELLRWRLREDMQLASIIKVEDSSEAHIFQQMAKKMGLNIQNLLLDAAATNSLENFKNTYNLARRLNLGPGAKVHVVQCPTQRLRAGATAAKAWGLLDMEVHLVRPEVEFSPDQLPQSESIPEILRLVGYGDLDSKSERCVPGEIELLDRFYPAVGSDVPVVVRRCYELVKSEFTRLIDENADLRKLIPEDLLPQTKSLQESVKL